MVSVRQCCRRLRQFWEPLAMRARGSRMGGHKWPTYIPLHWLCLHGVALVARHRRRQPIIRNEGVLWPRRNPMTARSAKRSRSASKSASLIARTFSVEVGAERPFIGYLVGRHVSTIALRFGSEIFALMDVIIGPDSIVQSISTRFVSPAMPREPTAPVRPRRARMPARSKKSASGKKSARALKSPRRKSRRAVSKKG